MSELMNFTDNEAFGPINEFIENVMGLDDNTLTKELTETLKKSISAAFSEEVKKASIKTLIDDFRERTLTKSEAYNAIKELNSSIDMLIEQLKPSENKADILRATFNEISNIYLTAYEKYHSYDIELPIQLDEGAQMPTYAHEDDAAADIYAIEDQVIPAHSFSNVIHTGVRFGTPEGWKLKLSSRSSIGSKTPMRLSNMIGLIDGPYRGELMILYDNLSDSDYTIHKGDRIAQVELEPVYRFKGVVVEKVEDTERGEGGFGSTGN